MAELTTSQLIKIILGLLVVIAVVVGAGLYFKDSVISFFSGISEGENETAKGEVDLSGYVLEGQNSVQSPVLILEEKNEES